MIELIVWLIQQLFGNQEPTARVGPRRRGRSSGGGYAPSGGGDRPRTLAELLDEARAELDGGSSKPAPPPPAPVQEPPRQRPRPKPAARQGLPGAKPSSVPPPPAPVPQVRVVEPPGRAKVHQKAVAKSKRKVARQARRVKDEKAQLTTATYQATKKKPKVSAARRGLGSWVSAMQSNKPGMKHQAAMIAIVGGVVLGPPKCRQRPGRQGVH